MKRCSFCNDDELRWRLGVDHSQDGYDYPEAYGSDDSPAVLFLQCENCGTKFRELYDEDLMSIQDERNAADELANMLDELKAEQ